MQIPKNKTVKDKNYVRWIKSQPCVITGQQATIHHLINYGTSGGAMKSDDYLSFPLCNEYHTGNKGIHRGVKDWEKGFYQQPHYIILTLTRAYAEGEINQEIYDKYFDICKGLLETFSD